MLALASPYCQHIDTRCEPSQSCGKLVLHIRSPMRIGNANGLPCVCGRILRASYRLRLRIEALYRCLRLQVSELACRASIASGGWGRAGAQAARA